MNTISFMSVNYIARYVDYAMTGGWGQGERSTREHFRPYETFARRFEEILINIKALGFDALDLWTAQLNPAWATEQHIKAARELLRKHDLQVVSLAGGFGATPADFEATCKLARQIGTSILGGGTPLVAQHRTEIIALLDQYDLRLGIENHPEKTPAELLANIGDGGGGRIGAAVDTGWFGTQGYNAALALAELRDHLLHVHLKDVRAPGSHDTCRFGAGVVPIEACVRTLREIGYAGAISIEHEPEDVDPSEDCRSGLQMVRTWLANG